jgi:hypothetical protein
MTPLLLAAETTDRYAFDATWDNLGMVVMGVIVTVSWLLFRKMLKLSEEKKNKGDEQKGG